MPFPPAGCIHRESGPNRADSAQAVTQRAVGRCAVGTGTRHAARFSRGRALLRGSSMPDTASRPLRNLYALACIVVLIAALYFARSVLIPVVLSVLLSFLLSPVMLALERRGLRRVPAAAAVVLATMLLFVAMAVLITRQV